MNEMSSPPTKKRKKKKDDGIPFTRPSPQSILDFAAVEREDVDIAAVTMLQQKTIVEVKEMKQKNPEQFNQLLIWYRDFIPKSNSESNSMPPMIEDPDLDENFANFWKEHGLPFLHTGSTPTAAIGVDDDPGKNTYHQTLIPEYFAPCPHRHLFVCNCATTSSSSSSSSLSSSSSSSSSFSSSSSSSSSSPNAPPAAKPVIHRVRDLKTDEKETVATTFFK